MVLPNSPIVTHCVNLVTSTRQCFTAAPISPDQLQAAAQLFETSFFGLGSAINSESDVEVLNFITRELVHSLLSIPNLPVFVGAQLSLMTGAAIERNDNVRLENIDPFLEFLDRMVGADDPDFESINKVVPAVAALCSQSGDASFRKLRQLLAMKSRSIRSRSGQTRFLYMLSNMLIDEEITVIVPSAFRKVEGDSQFPMDFPQIKAFRFRISRVSDNATLFLFITHHLWTYFPVTLVRMNQNPVPQEMMSILKGEAQEQRSSDNFTAPVFFSCWTVFNEKMRIDPCAMEHFIWHEGSPVDIAPFKGHRIVVITPPVYVRSFNVIRTFGPLKSACDFLGQIPEEETLRLVEDIKSNAGNGSAVRVEAETHLKEHHSFLQRSVPRGAVNL